MAKKTLRDLCRYADPTLNQRWWDSEDRHEVHLLQYETISRPRGITESRYVETQCEVTACARAWLHSGSSQDWVELPECSVESMPEACVLTFDEGQHHAFVWNGWMFESFWDRRCVETFPLDAETVSAFLRGEVPSEFCRSRFYPSDYETVWVTVPPLPASGEEEDAKTR